MKWIRERDALIAETMAFVQSVTGKKDGFHPPETPAATAAVAPEFDSIQEIVTVPPVSAKTEPPPAVSPPELQLQAQPQPVQIPPHRLSSDFRSEMQARIANFRKHQERFEREREEYCAATLTRLRAEIRNPSSRPAAEE